MRHRLVRPETSEDNLHSEGLSGFSRHHSGMPSANKRITPLLLLASTLMIIVAGSLHVGGAVFLAKTGFHGLSLNSPIGYGVLGLLFFVVVFKLKYVLHLLRRKGP